MSWDARTASVLSVYNVIFFFFPNIFRVMTVAVGSSNGMDSGKRSPQQFHLESKRAFVTKFATDIMNEQAISSTGWEIQTEAFVEFKNSRI